MMNKEKKYTSLDQLPLSLNANDIAEVLNISRGNAYCLLHREDFPTVHIGKRMVAPRGRFFEWMNNQLPEQSGEADFVDINYCRKGDYLFPNLCFDEEPLPIGKYGLLRKGYLKEHHPALYSSMLLTGKLDKHLAEIDRACSERVELITNQLAKREGVTESLKAADQTTWVARMNNTRASAEEIVLSELVYR